MAFEIARKYLVKAGVWPNDYDRILNGESATMLAMDAAEGRL